MERKNKDKNQIYYENAEAMEKPLSELMGELRADIDKIRGKLWDIKRSYGWEDRIDFIEGGLTCMLVSMYSTQEEWKKFEEKKKCSVKVVSTGDNCPEKPTKEINGDPVCDRCYENWKRLKK